MDIKELGREQWRGEIGEELEALLIPEWGEDVRIWFRPRDTGADRIAFERARAERGAMAVIYEIALRKSLREDGSRIWTDGERTSLERKYDPKVIERIGLEIAGRVRVAPSVDTASGN